MTHPTPRSSTTWRLAGVLGLSLSPACLTLDPLSFGNEPVDEYRWDADPCDPQLLGELVEAEERLHGGPAPTCHPSLVPPADRAESFVVLPDGRHIHYVFAHRTDATATIVYSHGTGRHIGRYWDRVELLWSMGYHVLIYDYPGFGRSDGEPSEEAITASAVAVVEQVLPTLPNVDLERVFFMGYSLGAAPTYELALRATEGELSVRPLGVVTEAAFCSTEALIQDGTRLDFPGEFLADNQFDNCDTMGRLDPMLPVLILHGANDTFVVPTHARMLLDASTGDDVTLRWIEGADHGELPVADPEAYAEALQGFIDGHLPQ